MIARQNAPAGKPFVPILILLTAFASGACANITGTVTIKGTPNSKDETFIATASGCGESPVRHTENWKIGSKGELADVVVWIVNPQVSVLGGKIVPPKITLKQIGCRYEPHVIVVQAGVPFTIINADPTLHNVHAKVYNGPGRPPGADVFNFGQSYQGQTDDRQFDAPGIYTLQCDVHNWMQCWVRVLPAVDGMPAACAVTDAKGAFKLAQGEFLADGDYKADAWHPRFAQPLEQTIHVKNGSGTVAFQFDGAKSF
ncbi:MAG TPA: hypothetical protein VL981_01800 [Candidatus Methylacidiphilales bacterium]|nr:hypothetical protein [Candidatus Methylacidiphilales bacterium]